MGDRHAILEFADALVVQRRAGVDVFTDGEQRRDDHASFVGARLDLAGVGFGHVAVLAVQWKPVEGKTKGNRRTADQILAGLARTSTPIPRGTTLVIVDDNVQSGASIAALDKLLGASSKTDGSSIPQRRCRRKTRAARCRLWGPPLTGTTSVLDLGDESAVSRGRGSVREASRGCSRRACSYCRN